MKLTLYRNKVYVGVISDNILPPPPTANSKTLTRVWRVGSYIGGEAKAGGDYQIKIEEKGMPASQASLSYRFEILALKLKKMKPKPVPKEASKKTNKPKKTIKATTKISPARGKSKQQLRDRGDRVWFNKVTRVFSPPLTPPTRRGENIGNPVNPV